jgi:hypothetical protein
MVRQPQPAPRCYTGVLYSTVMKERYPMTVEQRRALNGDLASVQEKLEDILTLIRACYGDADDVRIRAEESAAALQRLKWALERERLPVKA